MGIIATLYEQNNIKFMMTDSNIDGSPGWACMGKDFPFVTISRETSKWERRLIAAHEMAHLIFGHLEPHNSNLSQDIREDEARMFSCALMAITKSEKGVLVLKKIFSMVLSVLILSSMFCFAGCSTRTSITADDFKTLMESKGNPVGESSDYFSDNDEITHVYVALLGNGKYQIDFYETDTAASAKSLFADNKSILEKYMGKNSSHVSASAANYDSYKLTSDGYYRVLSRIDNTLIYVNVREEYKDEINTILNELGY